MFAQNLDAFGAGVSVVGEHAAEGDDEARVAGIARGCRPHRVEGLGLAVGGGVEGFVVGEGDVAVRWFIAVKLAIDAHRRFRIAGLGECASLRQAGVARLVAGEALDLADIRIGRIDLAQLIEGFVGGSGVSAKAIVARHPGKCELVVGIGKKNLLPDLDGDVGTSAGFQSLGLFDEGLFGVALFLSLGCGWSCEDDQADG